MAYTIITDSACDLSIDILNKWKIKCCPLSFHFEGERYYNEYCMNKSVFYEKLKNGEKVQTAAVSIDCFEEIFESALAIGNDILYIGFSSKLSDTYDNATRARDEELKKYPNRKIILIDSLCASSGLGLLLYLVYLRKEQGATIEDASKYALDTRLHICHYFTVKSLSNLKNGGRMKSLVASVGNLFKIKPIMKVNEEGCLVPFLKVLGKKKSLDTIYSYYEENNLKNKENYVFISHANAENEAYKMKEVLEKNYNAKVILVSEIGSVIGAHCGEGTLAIFFLGKHR